LVNAWDAFDDVLVLFLILNFGQLLFDDVTMLIIDLAKQRHRESKDDVGPFVDLVIDLLDQLVEILILRYWELPQEALEKLIVLSCLWLQALEQSGNDHHQLVFGQLLDLSDEQAVWLELLQVLVELILLHDLVYETFDFELVYQERIIISFLLERPIFEQGVCLMDVQGRLQALNELKSRFLWFWVQVFGLLVGLLGLRILHWLLMRIGLLFLLEWVWNWTEHIHSIAFVVEEIWGLQEIWRIVGG
jgi:hypothetical protein